MLDRETVRLRHVSSDVQRIAEAGDAAETRQQSLPERQREACQRVLPAPDSWPCEVTPNDLRRALFQIIQAGVQFPASWKSRRSVPGATVSGENLAADFDEIGVALARKINLGGRSGPRDWSEVDAEEIREPRYEGRAASNHPGDANGRAIEE